MLLIYRGGGELVVLVDSSVWIRYFANREPYASVLDNLLRDEAVCGHELIYGELLMGDRGGRPRLLADYERIQQVQKVPHREVVEFAEHRGLHGLGIGWIDAHLLAAALVGRVQLWTADTALAQIAGELGVRWDVGKTDSPARPH
jgi:predicted nucleic acid-binding protein